MTLDVFERRHPFAYGTATVLLFLATIAVALFDCIFASIAFADYEPDVALPMALGLSGLTAGAIWLAWRWSPARRMKTTLIACLYAPLLFIIAIEQTTLRSPEYWPMQHRAEGIYTLLACGALIGLALWYWRFRHPDLPKPNPEGWRTASYVIRRYTLLVRIIYPVLSVLMAITIFVHPEYAAWLKMPSKGHGVAIVFGTLSFLIAVVIISKLVSQIASSSFPTEPYIWADSSGLSVQGRLFLDWASINKMDLHWRSGRFGRYITGIDIFTTASGDEYLTIPFYYVTTRAREALTQIELRRPKKPVRVIRVAAELEAA